VSVIQDFPSRYGWTEGRNLSSFLILKISLLDLNILLKNYGRRIFAI
jgi:hypothetical protein